MTGYVRKDTTNNIADGNVINAADLDSEFDGVQDAFNASTGHKHDGTAGEGATINALGPTQDVTVSATLVAPKTTNTIDIGSSALKFKDLFLAGNSSIGGTLAVTGVATLTAQPILSSLTASSAVATDASKGLVSVTNTGTGNNVLATSPTLVTPILGIPQSATLTNATGLPLTTGVTGTLPVANGGTGLTAGTSGGVLAYTAAGTLASSTALAASALVIGGGAGAAPSTTTTGTGVVTALGVNTGSAGAFVVNGGALGTPSSGTLTNATGLPLTTGVTGTLPVANGGTNLTSFTSGGVVYASSTSALATGSALTFDGTNFGVGGIYSGYGANYPTIQAKGTYGGIFRSSDGAGTTVSLFYSSSGNYLTLGTETNHPVQFIVNNAEQMRLTSTGLGIGTSSPSTKLHVSLATAYVGRFAYDATYYTDIGYGGTNTVAPSNPFRYWELNGSEQMRLTSTGLGIGTSSPSQKLTVNGVVASIGPATALTASSTFLDYNTTSNLGRFAAVGNTTGAAAPIYFSQYSSDGSVGRDAAIIDSSGNLGVGTSSPTGRATVTTNASGGVNINESTNATATYGYLTVSQYTNGAFISTVAGSNTASDVLRLGTNNTERMRLDSSGNLLVGTTSASIGNTSGSRFVDSGRTLNITNTTATYPSIITNQVGFGGTTVSFRVSNVEKGYIETTTSAVLYVTTSDYRLKNITGPITTSGAYIDSLKPVEGTWKADGSTFVGLIAHETQDASRTLVATGIKDGERMQGIDYSSPEIIANLIAELQDLRKRLAAAGI